MQNYKNIFVIQNQDAFVFSYLTKFNNFVIQNQENSITFAKNTAKMDEEKKSWGGKRPRAGRPKGVDTKLISVKLETVLVESLPSDLNRSKYINDAVRERMKKDGYIE